MNMLKLLDFAPHWNVLFYSTAQASLTNMYSIITVPASEVWDIKLNHIVIREAV